MGFFSGNSKTENWGWSQTDFGAMDERLTAALGYAGFGAEQAARELGYGKFGGGLPTGLSLAELSKNPIDTLFGGINKFREFLNNPSLTAEQKKNLETTFMAPYQAMTARQGAQTAAAQGRIRSTVDELIAASREGRGASGVRGTTAGSGAFTRALAGLGQSQVDFERGAAADRSALASEAAGGLAGALIEMPFRNQQSMLSGLDALLQERAGRLNVRALSEDMRRSIMSNPAISALMSERLAGGKTTTYSKSSTPTPGWGSQLLGLGTRAALAYFTGGASEIANAAGGAMYDSPAGPAAPANYYPGWPMNPYYGG